jgi:putative membrane-bound dehydrogenase-like protein
MLKTILHCLCGAALVAGPSSIAEEIEADPRDLPRLPPTAPGEALGTFEVRPGFRLELAAHEPLVMDPIDIEFDETGRLFVVEMVGYCEHREESLGRIKLLHDDDDDGVFDRATIYAKDLKWPTSVCCFDGGIFVAASPDIFYFKDTDGDGVSDTRETVFTGFGPPPGQRLNMQAMLNSLTWGPDNRIWGATARNGGIVRRPGEPGIKAINLRGADFSFDPVRRDLRAENGTAQFGMSFDTRGRRFVCSNSDHLQWVAWERSWVKPNPFFAMPSALVSIAVDGGAGPVHRISPDEPWRVVRTRWRVAGAVPGPVEGGGRVSGYFTSASGITIYTGDAFGPQFQDNAFVGDVGSNLVHRKLIRDEEGRIQPRGERPAGERNTEFLRSRDIWFRPVNLANGPDGCLYICDMYREVIEHPWSLPEGIKKHLDLDAGNDRGRIWRVVPEGFQRPKFSLDRNSGWQDVTKRRLAFESGHPKRDSHPEQVVDSNDIADAWGMAFALNRLTTPAAVLEAWNDPAMRNASRFRDHLAAMIGKTGDRRAIFHVIDTIATGDVSDRAELLLASLGDGLRSAGLSLSEVDPGRRLDPLFATARETARDESAGLARRVAASRLLAFDGGAESAETLRELVSHPGAPDGVRESAIHGLASRPGVAELLVENWPGISATLKATALSVMTARPDRAMVLLEAIRGDRIPKTDIPANTATLLRQHRDAKVRGLAAEVIPVPRVVSRQAIVQRYLAALRLDGNAERGGEVYVKATCFTCHKSPDGRGYEAGPGLGTFKTAGGESLIAKIFDPNAEIAPQYQAYIFSLEDGDTLIGMISREDQVNVTVRMAGGVERTFARTRVVSMKSLGQSLMPEGLEAVLSPQDVADLLAFILR